jgi:hypothetical protein
MPNHTVSSPNVTLAEKTAPAGDFTMTAYVHVQSLLTSNWQYGLFAKDNTGKLVGWGPRDGSWVRLNWTNINTFSGQVSFTPAYPAAGTSPMPPQWWRLQKTGGNFLFSVSFDGEHFFRLDIASTTTFLGATLSTVGLYGDVQNAIADQQTWLNCYSFGIV